MSGILKVWIITLLLAFLAPQGHASPAAWVIDIKGAIGPATSDHMIRGLEFANEQNAPFVILRVDTPGGLSSAMRQMIKAILSSEIPIIAFVSPSGARAASAGTYLLYASHLAAMAPATNLGAATPVQIGTPSLPELPKTPTPKEESPDSPNDQPNNQANNQANDQPKDSETNSEHSATSAMERKIINDAVAYIQGLAELRQRNKTWAKQAVVKGASISSEQALKINVINYIAESIPDLLDQIDGQTIVINHRDIRIQSQKIDVYYHPIDWRSEFLGVITNPNVAYILLLIGIYGLIFEFSNPGMAVPGVIGAVCLLLAMYAFQVLPVNYAGLALIVLGLSLIIAEAFIPSFGILGFGGIAAFVMGSIILMDTKVPGFQIAIPLIASIAAAGALLLLITLILVVKARQQKVITGTSQLVGSSTSIERIHNGVPYVRLEGELWQAESHQPLDTDDKVKVTSVDGLILKVDKLPGE
ncbi:nodulation protein NfeD [Litoribacillus peritrichatus]|uniref:Nodulation protein NfeD n=1 Tax=Litoribacillus peritrichatus TaxID=718191 RepID=A0ABP7MG79_9GAMM